MKNIRRALASLCLAALLFSGCSPAVSPSPAPTPSPTLEVSPTPAATPTPGRAESLLAGMSLREKLCQLIVCEPDSLAGGRVTEASPALLAALEKYPVGGLILKQENIVTKEQTAALIAGAQSGADIPLFICADEEGGRVYRLMNRIGTTVLKAMFSYRSEGTARARENARIIASDMAALGFNLDLAPVADVWSNPENEVIGDRAYSDSFSGAAELIPAAVEGFHDGGVLCCLKHFPGHGGTTEDTHAQTAVIRKSAEELRREELLPFISGIAAGADMVMTGHMVAEAYGTLPASMSREITTGLLREELGFDGVVITDALGMGALGGYGGGEIAVSCVLAGADLLLAPADIDSALEALEAAVASGKLPISRVDESVLRVLELKIKAGILL